MNTLNYQYQSASTIQKTKGKENVELSKYSEVQKGTSPCFFWGKLHNPYELSRCLVTLSKVVQSSFNLSPFQMALLKDPIVTAGNEQIRFEAFSHCAGVYARVDILPDGQDGEFIENGTTNVDFNSPLISALGKIKKNDDLVLSVGKKEVGFHKDGESIIERKVPLPTKWIKGLTTVQHYFSESEDILTLNKIQTLQLFRSIPKGVIKTDYYIIKRGNKYMFSPLKAKNAICIGAIHRLQLLQGLIPLVEKLKIYAEKDMQSVTFVLGFKTLEFIFSVSRSNWRGFSGEGANLEALIEDVPTTLIEKFDKYSYANQTFNPSLMAIEEDMSFKNVTNLTAKLSAIGLLGYDLGQNGFFYRRLPFRMDRILTLNPRLKGAEKLLTEGKVEITKKEDNGIEARVVGTGGVKHYVILKGKQEKCTCYWYSKNQGERGFCKHVLAVKKLVNGNFGLATDEVE